ncbi:MAG: PKD domain-containing protein [Phycisphaerae bacterium]|nr:PKD domain-containing protein [Phycisphaerae bacterium]
MLLLATIFGPCAEAGTWWRGAWEYRVGVTFPAGKRGENTPTGLAGDDVGVVTFHHGGFMQADDRDVRVVTSRGKVVPHRILMTGPGDRCRVAFALQTGVPKYYVYFGNPNVEATKTRLDIQRGVLIEMWPYTDGRANTPQQALRTLQLAKSKPALGAEFAADIFQGCNPFGAGQNIVGLYTAWIVAPQAGEYEFATSSMNASFLWVDDALVVRNGGWHGPQWRVVCRGKVNLTAGLHKLTFLHVSPWGDPIAVVVWQPPGRKWSRVDAGAVTPVRQGLPGVIEKRGRAVNVDFAVRPGGEVFCRNRYYQRRDFVSRIQGRGEHGIQWRWEFGDGLSGEGQNIQHVFLTPGVYTIKLTAQGLGRPMEMTHRVEIDRPWSQRWMNQLERLGEYAKLTATYDLSKLSPRDNAEAAVLFQRARDDENLRKTCEIFLQRKQADAESIQTVLPIHVESLLATEKFADARNAVAALQHAASMSKQPDISEDMLLRAADVLLEPLRKPDEVMTIIQRVLEKAANRPAILRRARIALGDAWRVKGDREKARQAYNQAGVDEDIAKNTPAIARGDFARRTEAYLNTRDYSAARDALDQWEQALPADKLEGYSTMLRVELLLAEKQYLQAARLAETLVKVNPQSLHAPNLLMQAYRAYHAVGQNKPARQTLERLVNDYRESPLSVKAKRLLE